MLNATTVLIVPALAVFATMCGCASTAHNDWCQSPSVSSPSVGLRLLAKNEDRLEFEWRIDNPSALPIWIPAATGSRFASPPRVLVLPENALLCAFATPRISDEQSEPPGSVEAQAVPDVEYVKVNAGGQVQGHFSVELPFDLPPVGGPRSVFQYRGDYGHLEGLFSAAVEERQVTMTAAHQVLFAIEYWTVNPVDGVPDQKRAYDGLYWCSLVHQAVLAKKYPADNLAANPAVTRRIIATCALACEVPFRGPVTIYYAPRTKIHDQSADDSNK